MQSAAGGTKNLKDNDRPNIKRESVDKKQTDQKHFAYFRKHGEKKESELCNLVITEIIIFLDQFQHGFHPYLICCFLPEQVSGHSLKIVFLQTFSLKRNYYTMKIDRRRKKELKHVK